MIALQKAKRATGAAGNDAQVSVTCLLDAVIRKPRANMSATTSHILTQLGNIIDEIVIQVNSKVVKVNETVKGMVEELAAQGKTMNHLLNDPFEGCKVASDKSFVS